MIKILIVDDSETEIAILKSILSTEKDFEIVGFAKNGQEAVRMIPLLKPDIITMDIHMPVMDGFEATRLIMAQHPTPIVVISTIVNDDAVQATFKSLEAGAISVLAKPQNINSPGFKYERRRIIDTLRSMAEIKVIKRRFYTKSRQLKQKTESTSVTSAKEYEVLVIGASVGGPQALKTVLSALSADFPLPILVVQHMTPGFIPGFVNWLDSNSPLKIKLAEHHLPLEAGTVYFAPDEHHLEVMREDGLLFTKLTKGKPISGFCPSVTALFHSVAKVCDQNAIGVLLTGMGQDGAKGLLDLKQAGAHTLIQDRESAVVFGMAGVAQTLGAVDRIIELDHMALYLNKLTDPSKIPQ